MGVTLKCNHFFFYKVPQIEFSNNFSRICSVNVISKCCFKAFSTLPSSKYQRSHLSIYRCSVQPGRPFACSCMLCTRSSQACRENLKPPDNSPNRQTACKLPYLWHSSTKISYLALYLLVASSLLMGKRLLAAQMLFVKHISWAIQ